MRRRGEDGQNLVEFALMAPWVIALLFAIITIGLALNTRSNLQQAVREAARQKAVGVSAIDAKTLAAGNARENLTSAEVGICYPFNGSSRGQTGDPVTVYLKRADGTEGFDVTLVPIGSVRELGVPDFKVEMGPRATARLEQSVPAGELGAPEATCPF